MPRFDRRKYQAGAQGRLSYALHCMFLAVVEPYHIVKSLLQLQQTHHVNIQFEPEIFGEKNTKGERKNRYLIPNSPKSPQIIGQFTSPDENYII
jgi:hypothetical protein